MEKKVWEPAKKSSTAWDKRAAAKKGASARHESKEGHKEKWIKKAIAHPGSLRKSLHVAEGQKIPETKLKKAEHSKNPKTAKRARLADTLRKMKHK